MKRFTKNKTIIRAVRGYHGRRVHNDFKWVYFKAICLRYVCESRKGQADGKMVKRFKREYPYQSHGHLQLLPKWAEARNTYLPKMRPEAH